MIHPDSIPRLREGQTRIQEAVAALRKARMEGWEDTKEIETRLSEIAGQLRADTAEAIAEARRRAAGVEVDWEVLEGMGGLNAWVLKEIVAGALEEMEEGESATEETWKTNIEVCVVYESVWEEMREELELAPGTLPPLQWEKTVNAAIMEECKKRIEEFRKRVEMAKDEVRSEVSRENRGPWGEDGDLEADGWPGFQQLWEQALEGAELPEWLAMPKGFREELLKLW